ncbi:hypothetical protein KP509_19G064700 [Ceratopteris richardii]|uniref:Uncharacterized protein n=1 Tax=Ceratopteris richardii TaxID=49495 RepID=A0A8T2SPK4_CERRI|nr:hypothetical protein KP509_19G064700 [Ceratopteris richardii]
MEQQPLPLTYYCKNARTHLKRAAFCQKSSLFSDELFHLRKFLTLISSTIPSHPEYSTSSKDKHVYELLSCLSCCRQRIHTLEAESSSPDPPSRSVSSSPATMKKGQTSVGTRDSPSRRQQIWGIRAADPQVDISPASFSGSSSPSSRKRAMQKGKNIVAASDLAADKDPIVVPSLPLRPSSADQRLQSMIGGCALVANQLQHWGGKKQDIKKKVSVDAELSASPEFKSGSPNFHRESTPKKPLDYHPHSSQRVNPPQIQKRALTPPLSGRKDQKSPDKGKANFRFSPELLEKRLKDRMLQIQRQYPDTDEDASVSPSAKLRMSSDRFTMDTIINDEEDSSADENATPCASSSALDMFSKKLNYITDPSARYLRGRTNGQSLEDQEETPTERSHIPSSTDGIWARKIVPVVEQKLCHDVISRNTSQKSTSRSTRKKNRNRGALVVIDDAIRHAVDSDSPLSNPQSPHLLDAGQEYSSSEIRKDSEIEEMNKKGVPFMSPSEGLEAKFTALQDLVGELRRCMEGFTVRVEAEGQRWQTEMQGLEKKMFVWREDAECEMVGMKNALRDEMQKMMDDVRVGLIRIERLLEDVESSRQEFKLQQQATERNIPSMELIQSKIESLIDKMKVDLFSELNEKVKSGIQRDLDEFELGLSKQFEGIRKDMKSTLAEVEKTRTLDRQQIDAYMDEKIERKFASHVESIWGDKEKVLDVMKNDLPILWEEVEMLSRGREEMKDTIEKLANVIEVVKQTIDENQIAFKQENGMLQKHLQYFKKESMQEKVNDEEFRKSINQEVDYIRSALQAIKVEGQDVKAVLDKVIEAEDLRKKKAEDDNANIRERLLVIEKVESFSQQYSCGLEDIRSELLNFKLECQTHMEELELQHTELREFQQDQQKKAAMDTPLEKLVLDKVDSRVSHIEKRLEEIAKDEEGILKTIAAMEKNRDQTNAALDHVASTAQKADEIFAEMMQHFSSELENVMRESHKIQENLAAERDMAIASAGEVKRMSEDMDRGMQVAMAVISEAQIKGHQIKEDLEKEICDLKTSIILQKEEATTAAAAANDAAEKAKTALADVYRMQSDSIAMSEEINEATGHAYASYKKELETHLEECKRLMHIEISRAQSSVQGIEKDRQNIQEIASAIEQGNWLSQEEFEQHVKRTEDMLSTLAGSINELNVSIESHRANAQMETEKKDNALRHEIDDLIEKVDEAFTRLQAATDQNKNLENNLVLQSQNTEELFQKVRKDMVETMPAQVEMEQSVNNLETQMRDIVVAQTEVSGKVNDCSKKISKLENVQLSILSSVEGVQASTGDLQKSASAWLQKYDSAARLLQEFEKRILTLESMNFVGEDDQLGGMDFAENMQTPQKERVMNLYRELSRFVQRIKSGKGLVEDDEKSSESWDPLDRRLVSLENKLVQVETETVSNWRSLDTKLEKFCIGVQAALEGASRAENKCNALGEELVKLFRMMTANQRESPSKKMMTMLEITEDVRNEQQRPQSRIGQAVGIKSKSQAACNYCKKSSAKGRFIETTDCSGHGHARFSEGYNMEGTEQEGPTGLERTPNASNTHGKQSPQHYTSSREESPAFRITRHQTQRDVEEPVSLETMWKRPASDGRLIEGRLPITIDDRKVEASKRLEGIQISSGKPELQLTNIRLEAGKVHVNVGHRPLSATAAITGSRRADAFSEVQS